MGQAPVLVHWLLWLILLDPRTIVMLTATSTPTPTLTNSPATSATPTISATLTLTSTPTYTLTSSPTISATLTPTSTPTFTPTPTVTPSQLPTLTPTTTTTATPTITSSTSETPTRTPSPSTTHTATVLPTMTPSVSSTPTQTSTPTHTITPTWTSTMSYTLTGIPTGTPTDTPSSTVTPTVSETATYTVTVTPTISVTSTRTQTLTGTRTLSISGTLTGTDTATATHSHTQSTTPTYTLSATFTDSTTPTRTSTGSRTPTNTATTVKTGTATYSETMTYTYTESATVPLTYTGTTTQTATSTTTPTYTSSTTNTLTWSLSPTPSITVTVTETSTGTHTQSYSRTTTDSRTVTMTYSATPTPTPTWTTTPTPTHTPTPSSSSTETPSLTTTSTSTSSPSSTISPTPTSTTTYTLTPTSTRTSTSTRTTTHTHTRTTTVTGTPTDTFTYTYTASQSHTPTYTRTLSHTHTYTASHSVTATPSLTPSTTTTFTIVPTHTPTNSETASVTETHSRTWSITPSATVTPTSSLTPTPTVTCTPTSSASKSRTATTTRSWSMTISDTHTHTATLTPSKTYTPSRTLTVTYTSTTTPTATMTYTRTQTFTRSETDTRTLTPTQTKVPDFVYHFGQSFASTSFLLSLEKAVESQEIRVGSNDLFYLLPLNLQNQSQVFAQGSNRRQLVAVDSQFDQELCEQFQAGHITYNLQDYLDRDVRTTSVKLDSPGVYAVCYQSVGAWNVMQDRIIKDGPVSANLHPIATDGQINTVDGVTYLEVGQPFDVNIQGVSLSSQDFVAVGKTCLSPDYDLTPPLPLPSITRGQVQSFVAPLANASYSGPYVVCYQFQGDWTVLLQFEVVPFGTLEREALHWGWVLLIIFLVLMLVPCLAGTLAWLYFFRPSLVREKVIQPAKKFPEEEVHPPGKGDAQIEVVDLEVESVDSANPEHVSLSYHDPSYYSPINKVDPSYYSPEMSPPKPSVMAWGYPLTQGDSSGSPTPEPLQGRGMGLVESVLVGYPGFPTKPTAERVNTPELETDARNGSDDNMVHPINDMKAMTVIPRDSTPIPTLGFPNRKPSGPKPKAKHRPEYPLPYSGKPFYKRKATPTPSDMSLESLDLDPLEKPVLTEQDLEKEMARQIERDLARDWDQPKGSPSPEPIPSPTHASPQGSNPKDLTLPQVYQPTYHPKPSGPPAPRPLNHHPDSRAHPGKPHIPRNPLVPSHKLPVSVLKGVQVEKAEVSALPNTPTATARRPPVLTNPLAVRDTITQTEPEELVVPMNQASQGGEESVLKLQGPEGVVVLYRPKGEAAVVQRYGNAEGDVSMTGQSVDNAVSEAPTGLSFGGQSMHNQSNETELDAGWSRGKIEILAWGPTESGDANQKAAKQETSNPGQAKDAVDEQSNVGPQQAGHGAQVGLPPKAPLGVRHKSKDAHGNRVISDKFMKLLPVRETRTQDVAQESDHYSDSGDSDCNSTRGLGGTFRLSRGATLDSLRMGGTLGSGRMEGTLGSVRTDGRKESTESRGLTKKSSDQGQEKDEDTKGPMDPEKEPHKPLPKESESNRPAQISSPPSPRSLNETKSQATIRSKAALQSHANSKEDANTVDETESEANAQHFVLLPTMTPMEQQKELDEHRQRYRQNFMANPDKQKFVQRIGVKQDSTMAMPVRRAPMQQPSSAEASAKQGPSLHPGSPGTTSKGLQKFDGQSIPGSTIPGSMMLVPVQNKPPVDPTREAQAEALYKALVKVEVVAEAVAEDMAEAAAGSEAERKIGPPELDAPGPSIIPEPTEESREEAAKAKSNDFVNQWVSGQAQSYVESKLEEGHYRTLANVTHRAYHTMPYQVPQPHPHPMHPNYQVQTLHGPSVPMHAPTGPMGSLIPIPPPNAHTMGPGSLVPVQIMPQGMPQGGPPPHLIPVSFNGRPGQPMPPPQGGPVEARSRRYPSHY